MNQKVIETTVRYIDALRCSKALHLFTREEGAASHCQMGGISRAQVVIFDWLEEKFSKEVPAQQGEELPVVELPAEFLSLLEKYHGKQVMRNLQGLDLFHNQRGTADE